MKVVRIIGGIGVAVFLLLLFNQLGIFSDALMAVAPIDREDANLAIEQIARLTIVGGLGIGATWLLRKGWRAIPRKLTLRHLAAGFALILGACFAVEIIRQMPGALIVIAPLMVVMFLLRPRGGRGNK